MGKRCTLTKEEKGAKVNKIKVMRLFSIPYQTCAVVDALVIRIWSNLGVNPGSLEHLGK